MPPKCRKLGKTKNKNAPKITHLLTIFAEHGINKQYSPFGAKICLNICPRTLSVPRSKQFSESEARGKL